MPPKKRAVQSAATLLQVTLLQTRIDDTERKLERFEKVYTKAWIEQVMGSVRHLRTLIHQGPHDALAIRFALSAFNLGATWRQLDSYDSTPRRHRSRPGRPHVIDNEHLPAVKSYAAALRKKYPHHNESTIVADTCRWYWDEFGQKVSERTMRRRLGKRYGH